MDESCELVDTERTALVVWALAQGEGLSAGRVVQMTGLSRGGAYKLMARLSRVLPIYKDWGGVWQVMACKELEN